MVSAINDHIVPWQSSYKTTRLVSGPVRFVLSSGGHIAGIVNPPSPKAWYLADDGATPAADGGGVARRRRAPRRHRGGRTGRSWSAERAGAMLEPPPMGSEPHPVLGDAPGRYVHT